MADYIVRAYVNSNNTRWGIVLADVAEQQDKAGQTLGKQNTDIDAVGQINHLHFCSSVIKVQ